MVIALEGLPGSGKTTSARLLAQRLGAVTVQETTHDHPFVETIYNDAIRYDLQVELAFLLLHNAGYRRIPQERTVVTDFSPVKDRLFARALLAGSDLEVFETLYAHLYEDSPPPELAIYLDVSPQLCFERIAARRERDPTRQYEKGMSIDRLHLMKVVYERHMAELGETVLQLRVDGEQSEAEVVTALEALMEDHIRDD